MLATGKKFNYFKKEYKNPFFDKNLNRRRKKSRIGIKSKLLSMLIFLIIGSSFWFIFYSPYFKIKNINITGLNIMPTDFIRNIVDKQLKEQKYLIIKNDNILFFSKNHLRDSISAEYNFNKINIDKKFPDTLNLNLEEKTFSLVWKEDKKCYYINDLGELAVEVQCDTAQGAQLPLIENRGEKKISNKLIPFEAKYLDNIKAISGKVFENNIKPEKYILDNDLNTVKVKIQLSSTLIYFNTDSDLDKQINKLNVLIKEKLKDDFSKKEYIDLRYGDNVYYK